METLEAPERSAVAGGPNERLALHVCCGPCASAVIERLCTDWDVKCVWHNPNIQPEREHDLRLDSMRTVAERTGTSLAVLEYDVTRWMELREGLMDQPEGGARCLGCFRMRLEATARWAVSQEIGTIATTLSISPHKDVAIVNAMGREVAGRHGLCFLAEDFKKRGGFQRSVELSREWGLYRQTYCGCLPGMR